MTLDAETMNKLRDGLNAIAAWKPVDDAVRVTTHCMYPSGGLVNVFVRGGRYAAMVSDGGGAVTEALSAGVLVRPSDKQIQQILDRYGLFAGEGVVFCKEVPMDSVHSSIILVANASRAVATWLYDHTRIRRQRDFRRTLENMLSTMFDLNVSHNVQIDGRRKGHRFANVIRLNEGKKLLVDPVSNEASSINARVVANLDVHQLENPKIIQRLVYDDEEEEWSPDSLSLLGMSGVPVVPLSRSSEVIQRIAFSAGANLHA